MPGKFTLNFYLRGLLYKGGPKKLILTQGFSHQKVYIFDEQPLISKNGGGGKSPTL